MQLVSAFLGERGGQSVWRLVSELGLGPEQAQRLLRAAAPELERVARRLALGRDARAADRDAVRLLAAIDVADLARTVGLEPEQVQRGLQLVAPDFLGLMREPRVRERPASRRGRLREAAARLRSRFRRSPPSRP